MAKFIVIEVSDYPDQDLFYVKRDIYAYHEKRATVFEAEHFGAVLDQIGDAAITDKTHVQDIETGEVFYAWAYGDE